MTSYRFHYHPPVSGTAATGGLFIRIIHARKYRDIKRNYPVRPGDWDNSARRLLLPDTASGGRGEQLRQIDASMRADLSRLESIVKTLSEAGPYTVGDITRAFHETGNGDTVLSFAREVANQLEEEGRERTARAYRSAARSLIRFNGGRDLPLGDICELKLRSYERWLLDKGLQMNTVSFYMRNLRALYYRAAAAKLITPAENKPFENVYTGVYQTRRRSLDRQDINALAELEGKLPAGSKSLRNALLYFMFAYHARGMSFIDLAYLKKSDIRDGTIIYKRKKTGAYLEVKITRPMKKIIGRFRAVTKVSPYVFPIISPSAADHRLRYESALNRQNKLLKVLAELAGIDKNISTHVARHTWATLAKRMGYNISLISEGLGHHDTKVTSIYLASFERSALDEISTAMSRAVRAA